MTNAELSKFSTSFYNRWPSWRQNSERDAKLFNLFGGYEFDCVMRHVHTWDLENPDTRFPKLGDIRSRVMAEYNERENTYFWSRSDESTLAYIMHNAYDKQGLERPPIETVAVAMMGKDRGPTIREREKVIAWIKADIQKANSKGRGHICGETAPEVADMQAEHQRQSTLAAEAREAAPKRFSDAVDERSYRERIAEVLRKHQQNDPTRIMGT